jgi:hypothetical protein
MTRWFRERWAWAVVAGVALGGTAAADPPKPNDTITLTFPGQPEKKVTVVKSTRQPDGSYHTEVKDPKTGETFTLVDEAPPGKPGDKPAPVPAPAPKSPAAPKPPEVKPAAAEKKPDPKPEAKPERKTLFGRTSEKPPAQPAQPMIVPTDKPDTTTGGKKPGFFGRLLGRKDTTPKPPPPSMPAPTAPAAGRTAPPAPVAGPSPTFEPPRAMPSARPVPMPAPVGNPTPPAAPPFPMVMPPTPAVPPPVAVPAPLPVPMTPAPAVPVPVPTLPGSSMLPRPGTAPQAVAPRGGGPAQAVQPVGYVAPAVAIDRELQPHIAALRDALAPSVRETAAKALADGRHGSTPHVKAVLFEAAKTDPCPTVRACCIDQLCKLGCYDPAFQAHVKAACDDPDPDVRQSARAAAMKMTPRK